MNWYEINGINSLDSPALVIYKQRVSANIHELLKLVNNQVGRLRPHVKTNKIAEVCEMMMAAGINKFKCATIAEAEMLAMIGAKDVLLAYQPVGPKAARLVRLILNYPGTHFSCLIDNVLTGEELSGICKENNITTGVFIDLNTGMNRSGIRPSGAFALFEALAVMPALVIKGLHMYDGHIRDTDLAQRGENTSVGYEKVLMLANAIEAVSGTKLVIVAGGSPTFPIHAKNERTECSPGTFVFWDHGYKTQFPDEPFDYAALVVTRVVSMIDEHTVTIDLGHKSVAAENPLPRVHFLNLPYAVPFSQSEEHMVLKVPDARLLGVGHVLYGTPVHICPTVALYERAFVVENFQVVAEWKVIARDRQIKI
jgi:D-serine deaminase-like pyridoxal phosphate-dependent protein